MMQYRPPCDMGCDAGPSWEIAIMVLILVLLGVHSIQSEPLDKDLNTYQPQSWAHTLDSEAAWPVFPGQTT